MRFILSNEAGEDLLRALQDLVMSLRKEAESSRKVRLLQRIIPDICRSQRRHNGGLRSFEVCPNFLFEIKQELIKGGFINSSERRAAMIRVDESLGLYYKNLRDSHLKTTDGE